MANLSKANVLISLIFFTILVNGCASGQTTQDVVVNEYLLQSAGFKRWDVNSETPKREALLSNIPKGKITTFMRDGQVMHVYADENSQTLYVGEQAAYQKYLFLAQGKKVCERVTAENSEPFWSCFDEYQAGGPGQQRK